MRWKTYTQLDEKAQAYEQAADDALRWRVRRWLLPGESAGEHDGWDFEAKSASSSCPL
jgi:hypothetical protein